MLVSLPWRRVSRGRGLGRLTRWGWPGVAAEAGAIPEMHQEAAAGTYPGSPSRSFCAAPSVRASEPRVLLDYRASRAFSSTFVSYNSHVTPAK